MNTSITADIESYLKHDDVSLAVRRTLDMTLDTGDATLVQRSIDWSKQLIPIVIIKEHQLFYNFTMFYTYIKYSLCN